MEKNYVIKKGPLYASGWGEMGFPKRKQFLWTNKPERAWVFTPYFVDGRTDMPDLEGCKKVETHLKPHYA